jgi:ribosomal protein S12 methylthiotransferase accessory factor
MVIRSEIVAERFLDGDVGNTFFDGTHRAVNPAEMIKRTRPLLDRAEITRVADLTDLDRVGIPIAQAVRPMARSLSVSQGKGMTCEAAMAGATMEALEKWRAETCAPYLTSTERHALPSGATPLNLPDLSTSSEITSNETDFVPMAWSTGIDLFSGDTLFLPFDVVTLDFTRNPDTSFLVKSSNGLASGATFPEAVLSALLELIERDCLADFFEITPRNRVSRRVKAAAIKGTAPPRIIERIEAANLRLTVWDVANDIGIPAFYANLSEIPTGDEGYNMPTCVGSGCHPSPAIALCRAIIEAAQTRVTVISGVREDLARPRSAAGQHPGFGLQFAALFEEPASRGINHEDISEASAGSNLITVAKALVRSDVPSVGIVDLSIPEQGVFVARAVAPGLGHLLPLHRFSPGRRRSSGPEQFQ